MALKITLKPGERTIIGGAVLRNGNSTVTDLIIENNVPVLRQKDVMSAREADSVCRQIYFCIQLMYIDEENVTNYQDTYWELVNEVVKAAPRVAGLIDQINESLLGQRYYQALKLAKKLIQYEQEVVSSVQQSVASLCIGK
jgi:flagellar protein FlbT